MSKIRFSAIPVALVCLLAVTAVLSSCNMKKAKLQVDIENANKMCPVNLGSVGKMTAIKFDEASNQAQFIFEVNEDVVNIDDLQASAKETRDVMISSLSSSGTKDLIDDLVKADAGLAIIYKEKKSNKEFKVEFTPQELKQAISNDMTDEEQANKQLSATITQVNATLPQVIDEGMKMIKMYSTDTYAVYEVELDEKLYDMNNFESQKKDVKDAMAEEFSDPATASLLKLIKKTNRGLKYVYRGDKSGKEVQITFQSYEL